MRIKTIMLGGLIVGSLVMSAGRVIAQDHWHWSDQEHQWNHRADLRSDYNDLREAKRQLENDRRHHADRRRIADDRRRIDEIQDDINADKGR